MPRKNLIRSSEHFYHITSRTNNRDWFEVEMNVVWKFALSSLAYAQKKYPSEIYQFVLMNNHYHLLIKTPNADIDKFMYEFNKSFTLKIRTHSLRINKILGGRYKWSLITSDQYYAMVYRYIYQNPLRAGLASQCQNYPYSTLHYEIQQNISALDFELTSAINEQDDINEQFDQTKLKEIKQGMKKSTFKLAVKRKY